MNANELADELEKRHLLGGYASEAATMLRQQQDEIEALKAAKIRAYNNGVEDGRKPDTNNKPVAWRSKDRDGYWCIYQSPVKGAEPLYTHPAELTDEEILEVIKERETPSYMNFARAILRKAQEK